MLKRVLFWLLTAFVIALPVTGIWSLSLNHNSDWQPETRPLHETGSPKAPSLGAVRHYFQSLRFLMDDHESFGPFT